MKGTEKEYWQMVWDKFREGDREAFRTIYNEFIDVLFAYGSKLTSNNFLLEDAIQDVFINIYSYGKKLQHPEYLEYYLFKTLKHNIVRKLKESRRFDYGEENEFLFNLKFPVEDSNLDEQQLEKQISLLKQEIKNLDSRKRELLFLKFNSGLTYTEIGLLLDLKPDTVKKQVQRILAYFRKRFQNNFFELFFLCYKA
ncbi:sigma-70 family RNA polymerase sigma factor [Maribellus comscasis]|uniref:Sigma-70 family RNA polymerase sigma factor n=1 Tax=Maribellus comscasis TaxID=2681766 RepID=A0A6I6JQU8_9BACT|nr:sigma-70 family RNA polymerase sigma factor [Maribellus comscasis]QGY42477.1 sigma-70 family RNA polymerase sigma factor [Maribellus comscasis]